MAEPCWPSGCLRLLPNKDLKPWRVGAAQDPCGCRAEKVMKPVTEAREEVTAIPQEGGKGV